MKKLNFKLRSLCNAQIVYSLTIFVLSIVFITLAITFFGIGQTFLVGSFYRMGVQSSFLFWAFFGLFWLLNVINAIALYMTDKSKESLPILLTAILIPGIVNLISVSILRKRIVNYQLENAGEGKEKAKLSVASEKKPKMKSLFGFQMLLNFTIAALTITCVAVVTQYFTKTLPSRGFLDLNTFSSQASYKISSDILNFVRQRNNVLLLSFNIVLWVLNMIISAVIYKREGKEKTILLLITSVLVPGLINFVVTWLLKNKLIYNKSLRK